MEDLKYLRERYEKLKEENANKSEEKMLKKKIWRLEHKRITGIMQGISNCTIGFFKFAGKGLRKGTERMGDYGRDLDKKMRNFEASINESNRKNERRLIDIP